MALRRALLLLVTLGLAGATNACVQILGIERMPTETNADDAGDAGANDRDGESDGAADGGLDAANDAFGDALATRWCTTNAATDASVATCDDFDSPTATWQFAPPWDPALVMAGDASIARVEGGAGASLPYEAASEAQLTSGLEAVARLRKVVTTPARIAVSFEVRIDDLAVGTSIVRLVFSPSAYVDVQVERAGAATAFDAYLRMDGSGARKDFDTTFVQLTLGVPRRVRLDANNLGSGLWHVRAYVDGTLVAEGDDNASVAPNVAIELGARLGTSGARTRHAYDNVVIETW